MVIKTQNDIYVLKLKVDESGDNALAQIDSKGYAIPYEADGRTITKCGVTISSEARNIVHWRAVDNEGKVINEQKFWYYGFDNKKWLMVIITTIQV